MVGSTLRTALALVLPFAVLMPLVASDVANGLFGWGSTDPGLFAPTIALFAPALVPFTIHYLMLRGFYALEATRTAFFVQCAVSATNVTAALLLVGSRPPVDTAPMLVVAYFISYLVGSVISFLVLRRRLGELEGAQLLRFGVRMALVLAVAAVATWGSEWALAGLGEEPHPLVSLARAGVSGLIGCVVVVVGARLMHVREVTTLVDTVAARLHRG